MPAINAEGACHCGAIEFKVEGEITFNGLCHCHNCTANRGVSPMHLIGVSPKDGVKITKGEELLATYNGTKGTVTRCFCSKCGALVHQGPIQADFRAVSPVAFKASRPLPKEMWPQAHMNYESRTFDWEDSLPKFKAFPGQGEVDNQGKDK